MPVYKPGLKGSSEEGPTTYADIEDSQSVQKKKPPANCVVRVTRQASNLPNFALHFNYLANKLMDVSFIKKQQSFRYHNIYKHTYIIAV